MTVQASGRAAAPAHDPAARREAILAVEEPGARRWPRRAGCSASCGATRPSPQLAPQPGVASLQSLIERGNARGLPVDPHGRGRATGAAPRRRRTAYRVVARRARVGTAARRRHDRGGHRPLPAGRARARGRGRRPRAATAPTRRARPRRAARAARGSTAARSTRRPRPDGTCSCQRTYPTGGPRVIRVFIADDQALVRGGFRMILDAAARHGGRRRGQDGSEALERSPSSGPTWS